MVTAVGIDIVEIARIDRLLKIYGVRFERKVLGDSERKLLLSRRDQAQFVAGRFACKEAIIKALGRYLPQRPAYHQIEIIGDEHRGPVANFPAEIAGALGRARTLVSISHEKTHAVAMAVVSEEL